ncbi:ZIP family metal transporter [Heliorestis acidaminivorans]|uniref:ZIP family metal transporter n=1 Tax=Heliorestis acidaminivorans TaxID=553427 RepID=A0A6I0F1B2_9FIRM|nr:ZIP family metal transporter [Heliorestis acidaminivorans]KAB2952977.1 ZIP family metal transporter [Heliorestis acidaminivorans]
MSEVFWASFLAGSATLLGAIPLLFLRRVPHMAQDAFLGFAAGVMIAASFTLLGEGMEIGGSFLIVIAGLLVGAIFVAVLGAILPDNIFARFLKIPQSGKGELKLAWLTFTAVMLHNIPEGLVVGVGYGSGDEALGLLMAVTIGIQNAPEGLVIAAPLKQKGVPVSRILLLVAIAGLIEPVAALFGFWAVDVVAGLLPFALGFAGGAMLYVTSKELIPESHGHGFVQTATFALLFGVITMLSMEAILF